MIGIISDIHGNYAALKEVLGSLDSMSISDIYCLGDVVGYYSQVNECCNELRHRNVKCIMGNHDWYMVSGNICLRSNSVNDCLAYQKRIISVENLRWLTTFPFFRIVDGIFMVHGGWKDPIDEYMAPNKDYFDNLNGTFFLSGHLHIQKCIEYGNKVYCNPGSVGQPRDNDPRAAYATFDGKSFSLHRADYDISIVEKKMEAAGFNGYYYGCLRTGSRQLQWHNK